MSPSKVTSASSFRTPPPLQTFPWTWLLQFSFSPLQNCSPPPSSALFPSSYKQDRLSPKLESVSFHSTFPPGTTLFLCCNRVPFLERSAYLSSPLSQHLSPFWLTSIGRSDLTAPPNLLVKDTRDLQVAKYNGHFWLFHPMLDLSAAFDRVDCLPLLVIILSSPGFCDIILSGYSSSLASPPCSVLYLPLNL